MRWTRPSGISGISGTLFSITHRVSGPPRHIHEHNLNQEAIPASTVRTDAVRFRGGAVSLATVIVEPASGTPDERSCISTPDRRLRVFVSSTLQELAGVPVHRVWRGV